MSSEEGTRLRGGKIIELATNSQSLDSAIMFELDTVETEFVGDSSVLSQILMRGSLTKYSQKLIN